MGIWMSAATGVEPGRDESLNAPAGRSGGRAAALRDWRNSAGGQIRTALYGPVAVYVAAHGVMMALFAWSLAHQGGGFLRSLTSWDANWYSDVAQHGYEHHLKFSKDGRIEQMRIAFFPLLPWLERFIAKPTGMDTHYAGLIVVLLAALVAAAGIHAVLKNLIGDRAALVAVALWAAAPPSIYQSNGYSESLFTAFSVWALWGVLRRRWLLAAVFTVGAGLSRSTAVTLIAVVCLAALVEGVRKRDWRALAAVVIAPMGFVGFMLFLGARTGHLDAWFQVEKAPYWESTFDYGKSTFEALRGLAGLDGAKNPEFLSTVLVGWVVLFGIVALGFLVRFRRKLPWELLAWTFASVALSLLTGGGFSSKARFLLPYFTLFVPFAVWFARSRTSSVVTGVVVIALLGGWYGAYFLGPANHMSP